MCSATVYLLGGQKCIRKLGGGGVPTVVFADMRHLAERDLLASDQNESYDEHQ